MAKEAGIFTTLLKTVTDLGLVDTLKNAEAVTVFAPTDDAFASMPFDFESFIPDQAKEIVLRHVVDSKLLAVDIPPRLIRPVPVKTMGGEIIDLIKTDIGKVLIAYEGNTIIVRKADIMARNGVIHIIDKVILPVGDVIEEAKKAGIFNTLLKIVTDLGLVDALKEAEAVTVFAPPDKAFAKLPNGTIESLTQDQAKEIVLRHVIPAKVLAADVVTGPVETLGGEVIDLIKTDAGGVQITYEENTITVDKADVMASNGVIHIIDKVILPAEGQKLLLRKKNS